MNFNKAANQILNEFRIEPHQKIAQSCNDRPINQFKITPTTCGYLRFKFPGIEMKMDLPDAVMFAKEILRISDTMGK